jgi:hypothetical protein
MRNKKNFSKLKF